MPGGQTALLASGAPKRVKLNPETGAVVAVAPLSLSAYRALEAAHGMTTQTAAGSVVPDIYNHNVCNYGNGCYYSGRVPYANQGFYGYPGSFQGVWPDRNAFDTGYYTAYVCWTQACSYEFGPNTYADFGGSLVTGTQFTIVS